MKPGTLSSSGVPNWRTGIENKLLRLMPTKGRASSVPPRLQSGLPSPSRSEGQARSGSSQAQPWFSPFFRQSPIHQCRYCLCHQMQAWGNFSWRYTTLSLAQSSSMTEYAPLNCDPVVKFSAITRCGHDTSDPSARRSSESSSSVGWLKFR